MKCPKCGYLGFEDVERCRNCGYDFSLTFSPAPDLPLRAPGIDDVQPLKDLTLADAPPGGTAAPALPLFGSTLDDDAPLITKPSPPRTPLAVRRATPEVPRLRADPRTPMLDLTPPEPEPRAGSHRDAATWDADIQTWQAGSELSLELAGFGRRVGAIGLDIVVLAAIDAIVIYFTMQICGLTFAEISLLPRAPLFAFIAAQNLGYFIVFTTGGQTLGKMATGIKVISAEENSAPDLQHAIVRVLIWMALAIPGGLGFLTAFFGPGGRGLHDRVAGTRVVRANA